MFSKLQIFFCLVALAASQGGVSNWVAGLGLGGGFGAGQQGFDHSFNSWGTTGDVEDQVIMKNLVRLDATNRPLARHLLHLDVADREVVGDLARGINHVIIKKGNIYPLTLWDRVLKIKGANTHFGSQNVATQTIENHWVQTEIEDKQILEDLAKVDNVDRQIVTNLLWTDVVDRKIVADLAKAINHNTMRKGPAYPRVLLHKLTQINGEGSSSFGGAWGGATHFGSNWGGAPHFGNAWNDDTHFGGPWGGAGHFTGAVFGRPVWGGHHGW